MRKRLKNVQDAVFYIFLVVVGFTIMGVYADKPFFEAVGIGCIFGVFMMAIIFLLVCPHEWVIGSLGGYRVRRCIHCKSQHYICPDHPKGLKATLLEWEAQTCRCPDKEKWVEKFIPDETTN